MNREVADMTWTATEALALASVSRDTVEALTDDELRRLEGLCHEAIGESVGDVGTEDQEGEGLPLFVATPRGIGVNDVAAAGLRPSTFEFLATARGVELLPVDG